MDTIIPKRFLPHLIFVCIWVSIFVYGAMNATIKSPVSVNPAFHISSASTQCDPSITCSSLDVFQPSCTITGGLTVSCGSTTIQAGESYDIVANVAGGASGASHSWTATTANGIVSVNPSSGSFSLNSGGAGSFTVHVFSLLSTSGSDTVTVTVS
ncbi:MAG TPA: hypothetical protein VFV92_02430 [Candidatus Bathyarchaeia archaeon]|nr:hypothetical protein [Candidatus Bathyarchaeia archaeon]